MRTENEKKTAPFLFSVDLEDVRSFIDNGSRYAERVPAMTRKILDFLEAHGSRTTFFVVGDVVRRYPELVREIADRGHEIACHSDAHIQLDKLDATALEQDLDKCLTALSHAGVKQVLGFRAPTFSLTEKTQWAYEVLRKLGFTYSSSVLPAKNPLYGWAKFGQAPRRMEGLWEVPVSLLEFGPTAIPFAGGIYLRVLPSLMIRGALWRRKKSGLCTVGYIHPYDIDQEQERFVHPLITNALYHHLMYYNRGSVFGKLDAILATGTKIERYADYVQTLG